LNNHIGLTRRLATTRYQHKPHKPQISVAPSRSASARLPKVDYCDIFANEGLRDCQPLERDAGLVLFKQIQNNSDLLRRRLMHCVG
jgi:hypothetical protein